MSQEGLNGHFMLLRTLCEICSRKLLELQICKKHFSDSHLPPRLYTPSGWFNSTSFLHWQFQCRLISIAGLNPLKILSLESLAAFVKMQPKYLIESSSSAQTDSAIYVCRVTSASPAASRREPEPAWADVPWCQQRQEFSRWVRAFCWCREPRPRLSQTPQLLEAGGVSLISSKRRRGKRWVSISSTAA